LVWTLVTSTASFCFSS